MIAERSLSASVSALSVRGVSKAYPGVVALKDVSLEIASGTVHALVGENGAGKSTLVKIITGAIDPDAGSVELAGEAVGRLTPETAQRLGVAVVHQERQIAPDLSVAENVLLGRLPRRGGVIRWTDVRAEARRLLALLGRDIGVRAPARTLGVAEAQELEIARALSSDARLLVMDEPTSALGAADVGRLFELIRRLSEHGVAILYISHHLDEIFEIADDVTVMRDGAVVATHPAGDLTKEHLVALMVGRQIETATSSASGTAHDSARPVLEARDVAAGTALRGVSLALHPGEILGITGVLGSGRRELARCLAGVERPDRGSVTIEGHPLTGPRKAIRRGVVFVPADRKRESLMLDHSVSDNILLGETGVRRSAIRDVRAERRRAAALVDRLGVRARSLETPVRWLSGGNQQKVVLARWLNVNARVMVLDEPTAGVDVGAKLEIYALLRDLAAEGAALVVCSSDYEELKLLASRVIVLRRGTIAGELAPGEVTESSLLNLALGAA